VVLGAELVSWSAVLTLRHAGCRTALMVSGHHRPESPAPVGLLGRVVLGVRVAAGHRLVRVVGHGRLEAVEIEEIATGRRRAVACDTLVVTGDWIPDNELARSGGLQLDPASLSPLVDTDLRTSAPGVFAAGNLVHPVDTADVAALAGRHAADRVRAWLDGGAGGGPWGSGVRLRAEPPLRWVAPGLLRFGPGGPTPPRRRFVAWTEREIRAPRVRARQDGRVLAERRLPWSASPGRAFRIPADLVGRADPDAGDVRVELR